MTAHASAREIDPVCGMMVGIEEVRADGRTMEHQDRTYGFSSKGCLVEFRESPGSYAEDLFERSAE